MGRLFVITQGEHLLDYMSERWGKPLASDTAAADRPTLLLDPSRQEVEAELRGTHVLAFFGHGTPNALGAPALIDLKNIHQATGVVVAIACRSAQALAPAAVAAGASAYVGFVDDVPVIDSAEIDSLIREGFARLLAGEESPGKFGGRFLEACERLQADCYAVGRGESAYIVGLTVQNLKQALRVLER